MPGALNVDYVPLEMAMTLEELDDVPKATLKQAQRLCVFSIHERETYFAGQIVFLGNPCRFDTVEAGETVCGTLCGAKTVVQTLRGA